METIDLDTEPVQSEIYEPMTADGVPFKLGMSAYDKYGNERKGDQVKALRWSGSFGWILDMEDRTILMLRHAYSSPETAKASRRETIVTTIEAWKAKLASGEY